MPSLNKVYSYYNETEYNKTILNNKQMRKQ